MAFKAAFGASSCSKTICIIIGVSCRYHFSCWRLCARKPFHVENAPPETEQAGSSSNPLSFVAETHPLCVCFGSGGDSSSSGSCHSTGILIDGEMWWGERPAGSFGLVHLIFAWVQTLCVQV